MSMAISATPVTGLDSFGLPLGCVIAVTSFVIQFQSASMLRRPRQRVHMAFFTKDSNVSGEKTVWLPPMLNKMIPVADPIKILG